MGEIKEREITVKLDGRLPFAVRALYSEKLWGWVAFVDVVIPERDQIPEHRERIPRENPPHFPTPYLSLGEAVAWLVDEIESGRFDRSLGSAGLGARR